MSAEVDKKEVVLEFHCSKSGELVTLDECFDCDDKMKCDIYASMLDEK